ATKQIASPAERGDSLAQPVTPATPVLRGEKPGRTDQSGDPLPPGAIARLGTVRFRHLDTVTSVAYAPDGKTLATVVRPGGGRSPSIHLWDLATGQELRSATQGSSVSGIDFTFSPDGKILAWVDVLSEGNKAREAECCLRLQEVGTGKQLVQRRFV